MKRFLVLMLAVSSFAAFPAQADPSCDEGSCQPSQGQVDGLVCVPGDDAGDSFTTKLDLENSIAATKRVVNADIADLSDELRTLRKQEVFYCALGASGLMGALFDSVNVSGAMRALQTVGLLERALGRGSSASAPLHTPLSELEGRVPFTAEELKQLRILKSRNTPDLSDRIRLAVETQNFLMGVSKRLYDEAIQAMQTEGPSLRDFISPGRAKCELAILKTERNQQLLWASKRILSLLNLLELELRD